jgi:hypothetical protein
MKSYAGIGSRETPEDVLKAMEAIATSLSLAGYILRSGGADGADTAFFKGCNDKCEIFLPWSGFNGVKHKNARYTINNMHYDLAKTIHPAWDRCKWGARKLHARNTQQVLGENLNDPVDFVICWTSTGGATGGTATAIRLAMQYDIPVYNLKNKEDRDKLKELLIQIKENDEKLL